MSVTTKGDDVSERSAWKWSGGEVRGNDGYKVAQVFTTIEETVEQFDAKGKLIAAAPELVAACQAALVYIPGSEVRSWPPGHKLKAGALAKLKAALAKAGVT